MSSRNGDQVIESQAMMLPERNPQPPQSPPITVAELIRAFWGHAIIYYQRADGRGGVSNEADLFRQALRPLAQLFGELPAAELGPRRLKEVREAMIALGWCRSYVNGQVGRVKRMYRWAVESELVPPPVYQGLAAVAGLKLGRTSAPEGEPVKPVPEHLVEATLRHLPGEVAAMVRLQLLTGMRPGEVTILRTCDLDRSGPVWAYRPSRHKTRHHGHERVVYLGPQAQELLRPHLREGEPEAPLFSPAEAERRRRAELHRRRATPMDQGNVPGSNVRRRPRKRPGSHYRVDSYRRAIARACDEAFPPPAGLAPAEAAAWRKGHRWHPHQLRHNVATRLRKLFGIDAASVILGHRSLDVTQVYAEKDVEAAVAIMGKVG